MSTQCPPEHVNWVGTQRCHCSSCHQNFSVVKNFDKHRFEKSGDNYCHPPESVGLVLNKRGTWQMPGEVDYDERFGR